ncbi:hypothetical protein GA0070216_10394 [Micromonospora matsumotoense]|uniref:Uncharacterized protein n=1 Tax=Micromonospora matsumotoense TaxID=121616 RepID=A0A1C4W4Y3_9ACTN|nr:hypothetical protein GA0070216_10394 [Micromonospora matsumotoense]
MTRILAEATTVVTDASGGIDAGLAYPVSRSGRAAQR